VPEVGAVLEIATIVSSDSGVDKSTPNTSAPMFGPGGQMSSLVTVTRELPVVERFRPGYAPTDERNRGGVRISFDVETTRGHMSRGRRWMAFVGMAAGCVVGTGLGALQLTSASATVLPIGTAPVMVSPTTTSTTAAPTTTTPAPPTGPGTAATAHVSIIDFGFSPGSITVAAGTTVTWTNTGVSIHSVTSNTGAFDSSPSCPTGPCINPGSSFSHLFTQAGTFSYHCRVHPNMTAAVIVTASTPSTTTTTTATPGSSPSGNPPVSAGGTASPTTTAAGAQLAFTGPASDEAWIALGALATIALGLALRPRRRPFPVPAPYRPTDRN
jgi:plastocyanin